MTVIEDLQRRACAALSAFDADTLVELTTEDIDFVSAITAVDQAVYTGAEGIRDWVANLRETFEWLDVFPTEVIEDGDRAVSTNTFRARGRASGVEVQQTFFQAARVRDGKAYWWRFFPSKEEALAAVGLT